MLSANAAGSLHVCSLAEDVLMMDLYDCVEMTNLSPSCCRQVEDLQAELQQERQHVHGLAKAVQHANSQHLTTAASLAQAEGRIAAFLHRYNSLST